MRLGTYIDEAWRNFFDNYDMFRQEQGLRKEILRRKINFVLSSEQKDLIDDFYQANYGAKIEYFWHEYYASHTGIFNVDYFPEVLYRGRFEDYANLFKEYVNCLSDKNFFSLCMKGIGVEIPTTILSRCGNVWSRRDTDENIGKQQFCNVLSNLGRVFLKPAIGSGGGRGCFIADFKNGCDEISGKSAENIVSEFENDFVVQECVEQSTELSKLYPNSVNTFRVVTYRWKDNFYCCPLVLRMGCGGVNVDNVSSGGIFIAVDGDGMLHDRAIGNGSFSAHPDTYVNFGGYIVSGVPTIISTAIHCHEMLPYLGSANWDFAIGQNNQPILIEVNPDNGGGANLVQRAHGKALFGEHTAEILRWLRVMKKTPLSKRKQYMFGYGVD